MNKEAFSSIIKKNLKSKLFMGAEGNLRKNYLAKLSQLKTKLLKK